MSDKPLGGKAYGSIPHLPNSRMGPGDHHCHEGQQRICTEKARDKRDRIIVTEKLDGSNVCIARVNGEIEALTRSGYRARTSPHRQHQIFEAWVNTLNLANLPDGHRVCGEWLQMAHGTIYEVSEPLICFDAFGPDGKRMPHDAARDLFGSLGLTGASVISDGPAISVADVLGLMGETGRHGATEQVEGAVWRVERDGSFDFICKYVRPDKVDGKYFTSVSGKPEIDLWRMEPQQ